VDDEEEDLKGRNMRFSLPWHVTQRRLVVSYRRFGTTYPSLLKG